MKTAILSLIATAVGASLSLDAAAQSSAPPAPAPAPSPAPPAPESAQSRPLPERASAQSPAPEEPPPKDSFTGDPFGDESGGAAFGALSFRALLQARYRQTSARASRNSRPGYAVREDALVRDGDGFDLQRLFLRIAAEPTPKLGFKTILDFSKLNHPENVIKQAYASLRPVPKRVEIAIGVVKLPFSTMELDPIARFELADLGGTDDLLKNLGFAGRDLGAELMFAPLKKPKWLRLTLGAFRGHAQDEHASPLGAIGARLESKPLKGLRLGVDAVGMPQTQDYKRPFETSSKDVLPNPSDPLYPREQRWAAGKAYGADVTYDRHRLMLRAEGLLGDRVDVEERYGARSFWAAWFVAAYEVRAGWLRFTPALRAEWLDLDREHDVGQRRELSAGVSVPYEKQARFLLEIKRTDVQRGTPVIDSPKPIPAVPYFERDSTRVTLQFQLEL